MALQNTSEQQIHAQAKQSRVTKEVPCGCWIPGHIGAETAAVDIQSPCYVKYQGTKKRSQKKVAQNNGSGKQQARNKEKTQDEFQPWQGNG